jgi:phage host-nuclease inhibitor protein Gam
MSAPDVMERLRLLEEQVQRAIERIGELRAENARLRAERGDAEPRVAALTAEIAALRQKAEALARLEVEHRRLLEERHQLLGQIDGVLKDLARIEGV